MTQTAPIPVTAPAPQPNGSTGCARAPTKSETAEGPAVDYKPFPPSPVAEIFPLRDDASLDELTKSIAEQGLKEEIVLYCGQVLDGRRRQIACLRAKVKPLYRDFGSKATDGFDPVNFAFHVNYHRRDDLTKAEKALAAAKFGNMKAVVITSTPKAAIRSGPPPRSSKKEASAKFGVPIHGHTEWQKANPKRRASPS